MSATQGPQSRFGPGRSAPGSPPAERLSAVLAALEQLVDWERRDRSGGSGRVMRVDVAPARDLLERLGSPQERWPAVHIAGSKGKGSVAALVAAGLEAAGHRCGIYASPHVERLNERIRISGEEVEDEPLAVALEAALAARTEAVADHSAAAAATWFDLLTAAAFSIFADRRVDWAVVECGLGGRLDSTNALRGEVCVITGIELEHTAILGDTREAIAFEKAGILERGRPAVVGLDPDDPAARVIAVHATELEVPLTWRPPVVGESLAERNRGLAVATLDALGGRGARTTVEVGGREPGVQVGGWLLDAIDPAAVGLPGRLERCARDGRAVILDGAHVPTSLRAVLDETERWEGLSGAPVVVFGAGRDKDVRGLLKVLVGRADSLVCTSVGTGPVHRPEELARVAEELGMTVHVVGSPRTALSRALELASPEGWVLVTGSLHLVGAVRGDVAPFHRTCSRSSPTSS